MVSGKIIELRRVGSGKVEKLKTRLCGERNIFTLQVPATVVLYFFVSLKNNFQGLVLVNDNEFMAEMENIRAM